MKALGLVPSPVGWMPGFTVNPRELPLLLKAKSLDPLRGPDTVTTSLGCVGRGRELGAVG